MTTFTQAHRRLQPLLVLAQKEGWLVVRTPGGHLKLTKTGLPAIYTGSTPSDPRAVRNAVARWRREIQDARERNQHE